jgi:hypothetical protein
MKLGLSDLLGLAGAIATVYGGFQVGWATGWLAAGLLALWFAVSLARWEARRGKRGP